jgi:hypothetical protein
MRSTVRAGRATREDFREDMSIEGSSITLLLLKSI